MYSVTCTELYQKITSVDMYIHFIKKKVMEICLRFCFKVNSVGDFLSEFYLCFFYLFGFVCLFCLPEGKGVVG